MPSGSCCLTKSQLKDTYILIDAEAFILHASRFLKEFSHAIGRPEQLIALVDKRQTRYLRGISTARALYQGVRLRNFMR